MITGEDEDRGIVTYPIPQDVLEQLARAEKFIEDYEAGRVERGVNAIAFLREHARPCESE
jgi:hypothetical protein